MIKLPTRLKIDESQEDKLLFANKFKQNKTKSLLEQMFCMNS